MECEVVNTGQEGLDRIRAENFDLILLDLAMPEFSGMDVILSLKLDGLIKSRNIVIFTASSNQDLLHEIMDIGVKEIFKKPFSLDDLIKLIEKYRPSVDTTESESGKLTDEEIGVWMLNCHYCRIILK